MQAAEISLEEKDQRIGELDRLIERMEKVRIQPWACCVLAQTALSSLVSLSEIEEALNISLIPLVCHEKKEVYIIMSKEVQQIFHFSPW